MNRTVLVPFPRILSPWWLTIGGQVTVMLCLTLSILVLALWFERDRASAQTNPTNLERYMDRMVEDAQACVEGDRRSYTWRKRCYAFGVKLATLRRATQDGLVLASWWDHGRAEREFWESEVPHG